eukprot:757300-Prorocentrum_minimum.AAC.2
MQEGHLARRKGILPEGHRQRLEELGLVWKPTQSLWEQRLQELVEFKATFGHCNVPNGWEHNRPLALWVPKKRQQYRQGELSIEKVKALTELGFQWDPRWEERLQELLRETGVLQKNWENNRRLVAWVNKQREQHAVGRLSKQQAHRLEELGLL